MAADLYAHKGDAAEPEYVVAAGEEPRLLWKTAEGWSPRFLDARRFKSAQSAHAAADHFHGEVFDYREMRLRMLGFGS